jgi:hypothetical protein
MEDIKFHPAVELALSRMESNPKEFTYEGGKWRHMLEQHTRWMSKEEKDAVNLKLRDINLENMRLSMMKKILSDAEREVVAQDGGGGYVIGGTSIAPSWTTTASLALGDKSLTQDNLTTLLELIEKYDEERSAY